MLAELWLNSVNALFEKRTYFNQEEQNEIKRRFTELIHETINRKSLELPQVSHPKSTGQELTSKNTNQLTEKSHNCSEEISSNNEPDSLNGAKWKYLPVPDEPDKHDECYCASGETPDGLKLIAARVRGKGHKHEGTNCDDWFEFAISGNWTIIAVSDGAGSKKFSRVGAKTSCKASVKYLAEELKLLNIKDRSSLQHFANSLNSRNASWEFLAEDIEAVHKILHEALQRAYKAIEEATKKRQSCSEYSKILNRELEVSDFAATLLLAIHTTVKVGGENYDLIFSCQVGDGMLAAISNSGRLQILGKPDVGEYGGQTDFLTSKQKLHRTNLLKQTFVFTGNLKALMVMTDGVADDYIPNDPGMLELYGDLVLNQVIEIPKSNEIDVADDLCSTQLLNIRHIKDVKHKFQSKVRRITDPNQENEPRSIHIASIAQYSREIDKQIAEIITNHALLSAATIDEQICGNSKNLKPEEKLQFWLNSYYQRGSFDDRTLVIVY